jgi:hypothetical protein
LRPRSNMKPKKSGIVDELKEKTKNGWLKPNMN